MSGGYGVRACLKSAQGPDSPPKPKPQGIAWDELTIAEHDLERGTRQKIEEPDTPFIRSPQATSEPTSGTTSVTNEQQKEKTIEAQSIPQAQQAEQLQNDLNAKLGTWFAREGHRVSIQEQWDDVPDALRPRSATPEALPEGSTSPDGSRRGSTGSDADEAAKKAFEDKRKQHYNEAAAVKALLARGTCISDDEDDSDEEEDEEKKRKEEEEKKAFADKRKQHYNEAAAVRAMLARGAMDDEDEDDDDDDEDEDEKSSVPGNRDHITSL